MKKRYLLIIIALVAGAVFMISSLNSKQEEGVLDLSGNVEIVEVDIGFKIPGRLEELFVEEGQRVQKGKKLASIESAELESEVMRHLAIVEEARARLLELQAGARPQELELAEAEAASAEAEFQKAEKDFERATLLYEEGAISSARFEAEKKAYGVSLSRLRAAKERLSLIQEGPRKEVIDAQDSRIKQAEAALRASEERLSETAIYAPISGVILRKHAEVGETTRAGIPVFTVGNLASPWVKVYVKEDKLGMVKLGEKAKISTDSYPEKVYEGTVTFISPEAEFTPKNVQTKEERVKLVFGIEVSVDNTSDELKPGMPADVRIDIR